MWLLLRMNCQVLLQVCCPKKCFATLITYEQLFSSVDLHVSSHVNLKTLYVSETLPTLITCKWIFSSVNSHVNLPTLFGCETLFTLITCERLLSSVNSHVTLKIKFVCETLSTLITCERLFSTSLQL
ncbi:hypothetical protein PO909_000722 [Leuciscus waleckii]